MEEKIILSMDFPVSDNETMVPCEITQSIEGGDPFFIYADRYHRLFDSLFVSLSRNSTAAATFLHHLARSIDNRHLQNAFRALMLLYVDKFLITGGSVSGFPAMVPFDAPCGALT
ncbi:MAG: hypothetical protein GX442_08685 [Candidatus Riflebacteria bacterium]|nr:hypothetical protein [Candidatus Riflebacteria bacterium]